ncbi:MAG TPA: hypothetical protein DDZ89_19480 [Clostridiales bacterium]|nr:hypothetical protein [Clostridiales bacterium]
MLSVCGIICDDCEFFKIKCSGCYAVSGRSFRAKQANKKICEIYDCCVKKRGLDSCGQCSEVPCNLMKSCRQEGVSEEEHMADLEKQVKRFSEDICPCESTFCSYRINCRKCYESHHDINSLPVCLR